MALSKEVILSALGQIDHPRRDGDIVSLGLIGNVSIDGPTVTVRLELPSAESSLRQRLCSRIESKLAAVEGVESVTVDHAQAAKAPPTQDPPPLPSVRNIIAVGAGKGGVGKSAIAIHLAIGLRRKGASVGLLDCDVYGPSMATMAGLEGATPKPAAKDRIAPLEAMGLKVITMASFVPPDQAMIWRGPMVHNVISQFLKDVAWGELDYLIVDLPPGTGDAPLTLAQTVGVTGAVIVATPQALALNDAMRAAQMYQSLGIHVLGVVENMSYFVCPACGTEHDIFGRGGARRAAEAASLPFLGEIPLSLPLRQNTDAARAEQNFDESVAGPVASAVEGMVEALIEQVRVRNATQPPAQPLRVRSKQSQRR